MKESLTSLLVRCSKISGISIADITSKKRHEEIVDARHAFSSVAFYDGHTYAAIGNSINRDHSSIMHLCNERPMTERTLQWFRDLLQDDSNVSEISALAFRVYQEPENEEYKKQLKEVL